MMQTVGNNLREESQAMGDLYFGTENKKKYKESNEENEDSFANELKHATVHMRNTDNGVR